MSYAVRKIASENDQEYAKLVQLQTRVEQVTQDWIDRATALHTASATEDKAELVTLRNDFATALQTILGV